MFRRFEHAAHTPGPAALGFACLVTLAPLPVFAATADYDEASPAPGVSYVPDQEAPPLPTGRALPRVAHAATLHTRPARFGAADLLALGGVALVWAGARSVRRHMLKPRRRTRPAAWVASETHPPQGGRARRSRPPSSPRSARAV